MHDRLTDQWYRVCDQWKKLGYTALTDDERLWLNVRALIDSVQNGGLISYFYNSGADKYEDCLSALNRLGASDVAEQVERLGAFFGDPVPTDIERRNEIINSWSDNGRQDHVVQEADDVLMPLMGPLEQQLSQYLLRQGFGPDAS